MTLARSVRRQAGRHVRSAALMAAFAVWGCNPASSGTPSPQPQPTIPGTFETADAPDVTIAFTGTLIGTVSYSGGVHAVLHDTTQTPKRVQVTLVSHGLDQRVLTASVGTFRVRPGRDRTFRVPFADFLVQCARVECEHEIYAQVVGDSEETDDLNDEREDDNRAEAQAEVAQRPPAARTPLIPAKHPLYARFIDDFRRVELFGRFGQDALLGDPPPARTFDDFLTESERLWRPLTTPSGRYFDGRAFTLVSAAAQHRDAAATYGETLALHGPRALDYQQLAPPGPIVPRGGGPHYAVCTTWKEVFIDSDWPVFGSTEDFFTNFTLADARARYTSAVITDASKAVVWAGFLDRDGCTGPITLPIGSYWLWQDSNLNDGKRRFVIVSGAPYVPPMGSSQQAELWFGVQVSQFSVSGNGGLISLSPNGHGSASRLAAAMGQVLITPDNGLRDGGFVYDVQAEQGCFASQNTYCTDFKTQTCMLIQQACAT